MRLECAFQAVPCNLGKTSVKKAMIWTHCCGTDVWNTYGITSGMPRLPPTQTHLLTYIFIVYLMLLPGLPLQVILTFTSSEWFHCGTEVFSSDRLQNDFVSCVGSCLEITDKCIILSLFCCQNSVHYFKQHLSFSGRMSTNLILALFLFPLFCLFSFCL